MRKRFGRKSKGSIQAEEKETRNKSELKKGENFLVKGTDKGNIGRKQGKGKAP